MQSLERVLVSIGEGSVAASLPWQSLWNPQASPPATELPATCAEDCLQAFSIAFQLLNVAEENAVAQARRQTARQDAAASESGSWEQALVQALERDVSPAALAQVLSELRIEPVLTAHTTEAKRQMVLEHHRTLYRLLVARENGMWTLAERLELDQATDACLERLWRTGEIYLEKPELADERRLVMHFLGAVFPEAVAAFEARLHQAWAAVGLEPGLLARGGALPRVVFGSWVGGDRDGHPGVTGAITAETLGRHRDAALTLLDRSLEALASRLSLSIHRQTPPAVLLDAIKELGAARGEATGAALARNPEEPFRQYANLLRASLPLKGSRAPECFSRASELDAALALLEEALVAVGATRLVAEDITPLRTQLRSFGFHLARLDVRQNSAVHDCALASLLSAAGVGEGATYGDWPQARRRRLLDEELKSRRHIRCAAIFG